MSVDTSNGNDSDSEIIEQNNVFEITLDAATNFKHALLASLYAHVKFLKTELEEKIYTHSNTYHQRQRGIM